MRCLQHVLWRGALAVGLLVSGGTGAMLMPQGEAPVCKAATEHAARIHINATGTATVQAAGTTAGYSDQRIVIKTANAARTTC